MFTLGDGGFVDRMVVFPREVLPNILGGGVPHGSQNPDPVSDQNILFCFEDECPWSMSK